MRGMVIEEIRWKRRKRTEVQEMEEVVKLRGEEREKKESVAGERR